MPTTRPRYTITDTGSIRAQLDDAQRRWPEVDNRKDLLLRLAATGHDVLQLSEVAANAEHRRDQQREALERLPSLVDVGVLLAVTTTR